MIWKLAEAGMNVARLNMSHGDHASHQKVIDLVKEYNAQSKDNVIAIMLDTKAGSSHYPLIRLRSRFSMVILCSIALSCCATVFLLLYFRAPRLGVGTCHNQLC